MATNFTSAKQAIELEETFHTLSNLLRTVVLEEKQRNQQPPLCAHAVSCISKLLLAAFPTAWELAHGWAPQRLEEMQSWVAVRAGRGALVCEGGSVSKHGLISLHFRICPQLAVPAGTGTVQEAPTASWRELLFDLLPFWCTFPDL